jgi:hypothetical protein
LDLFKSVGFGDIGFELGGVEDVGTRDFWVRFCRKEENVVDWARACGTGFYL